MTTTKPIGPGYEAFLGEVGKIRAYHLPETAQRYTAMNAGFRRMVARQAGMAEDRINLPLDQLSNEERRRLMEANKRLHELSWEAHKLLLQSVIPG